MCLVVVLVAGPPRCGWGEENAETTSSLPTPNLASPTLGGKQFWADELVFHDWRIQRNVWTGHYRLLDDHNVRQAWGSFEHCRDRLKSARHERQLPPLNARVVLVLHGLGRTRAAMQGISEYLREYSDFSVLNIGYPSTRQSVSEHAAALARIVKRLEGVREINFVAHSMGNLVIRQYFAESAEEQGYIPDEITPRRIVMLAPPNQGAELAERFRSQQLVRMIWGTSGDQIAREWETLENQLATPSCEFGIIAGGRRNNTGYNPLIQGDDDLIVSVTETRLPGARDFIVVPATHTTIMDHPQVQQYTLRFLEYGHFLSQQACCPIPREAEGSQP
jgi:pimeloyl-ACP methyl ester carboxylesterase